MFTKVRWDKSFIFNSIRLRREWLWEMEQCKNRIQPERLAILLHKLSKKGYENFSRNCPLKYNLELTFRTLLSGLMRVFRGTACSQTCTGPRALCQEGSLGSLLFLLPHTDVAFGQSGSRLPPPPFLGSLDLSLPIALVIHVHFLLSSASLRP